MHIIRREDRVNVEHINHFEQIYSSEGCLRSLRKYKFAILEAVSKVSKIPQDTLARRFQKLAIYLQ